MDVTGSRRSELSKMLFCVNLMKVNTMRLYKILDYTSLQSKKQEKTENRVEKQRKEKRTKLEIVCSRA